MIKLDLSYLESISGGDRAFIDDMLKMFLTSTFPEVAHMEAQAQNGQWELMGGTAHKMKAPMQMLGVPEVATLVLELEQSGKNKTETEHAVSRINQLKEYIKELETEINRYLQA